MSSDVSDGHQIDGLRCGSCGLAMNYAFLLKSAIGLRHLGMFEEAEKDLQRIPSDCPEFNESQSELVVLLLSMGNYGRAADVGMRLDAAGKCCRDTIFNTSLALSFLGRNEEAMDTLNRLPELGKGRPHEAYQVACLKSRLGLYPEALEWLAQSMRRSPTYSAKSLVDSDLQPLWQSLEGRALTARECETLLSLPFENLRLIAKTHACECELDENDFKFLPEGWRELFRFVPAHGAYFIHALTARTFPKKHAAFGAWYRQRIECSLQSIERARDEALQAIRSRLTPPIHIPFS